jgi:hypothetical protein
VKRRSPARHLEAGELTLWCWLHYLWPNTWNKIFFVKIKFLKITIG